MLSIGIVGAGFVAEFHRKALLSVRDVELKGIHALSGAPELAARAKQSGLSDTKVFSNLTELCKAVDVICICVPNPAHLEVMQEIAAALEKGAELKGIICEKPLARNLCEADELVTLAEKAAIPTAYFENQIHMPCVINARFQLSSVERAMGPVHLARSAEEHGGPHEPWFWDPQQQGGGVWSDMGCHSVAVGMYMLTPGDKQPDHLEPVSVTANMALLKWGKAPWIDQLRDRGVDYSKCPAEDYAVVNVTFKDPESKMLGVAQATNSWMYDAPGLRLSLEAFGAGYSYTVDSLRSPAEVFISDGAMAAIENAELGLEKSQATRGLLVLQPNEPDLYGYVNEWRDAITAFEAGRDGMLNFCFGRNIVKLVMAGYMAHEQRRTINLTDKKIQQELQKYIPLIQQGRGNEVLTAG
jgi:predicted dehydrogenase